MALRYSFYRQLKFVTEKKTRGDYIHIQKPFWQLGKKAASLLGIGIPENKADRDWAENIIWSNLYKVSYASKGNPSTDLKKAQLEVCKEIFIQEIKEFKPTHILIVSGYKKRQI